MQYPKRTQYKYTKRAYHTRNWAEYERGLRGRGDVTLWFSEDAIKAWHAPASGKAGGQRLYSRTAIETALTVRMVFRMALRQTEGFLCSLCERMKLDIPIPDHTTLSRRAKKLGKIPLLASAGSRPIHLLVDSTGLRVHVGHRRPPKGRQWRKMHVGVDAKTGEVLAVELTARSARDSCRVPRLLRQVDRGLVSFSADGAYDTEGVYESVADHARQRRRAAPRVLIPPRKRAQLTMDPSEAMRQRNRNIRSRDRRGRREWHKTSGYSRRALVENVMCRYKATFGDVMRARSLAGQILEARLGCRILNKMATLGMPDSYLVE